MKLLCTLRGTAAKHLSSRATTRAGIRMTAVVIIILAIGPRFSESFAYNTRVHLALTGFLLQAAGVKGDVALKIAEADEGMDGKETSAFKSLEMRQLYHFVTARRLAVLRMQALSQCTVPSAGQYFHALEDAFSHEGYDAVAGHIWTPVPDWPESDVAKAVEMSRTKFLEAGELANQCPTFKATGRSRDWVDVNERVRRFLEDARATTIQLQ